MQQTTNNPTPRFIAVLACLVAAGLLVHMGTYSAASWRMSKDLSGTVAHAYTSRVCAHIFGCEHLSMRAGFDWRNARRFVVYRMRVGMHRQVNRTLALREIRDFANGERAGDSDFGLAWALRTPVRLNEYSGNSE